MISRFLARRFGPRRQLFGLDLVIFAAAVVAVAVLVAL